MPRYTPAYKTFLNRMDEVKILRVKASLLERSKYSFRHGPEISALCRGAVVLLSSHVEAFVKELGEHTLDSIFSKAVCRSKLAPQFFYHISKQRIESIKDSSKPEKVANHIFELIDFDGDFWSRENEFSTPVSAGNFNKGFSNPKFEKVKSYLGRFGYIDYQSDFNRKLGGAAILTKSNLDQIVDTRNSIAHGDPSATKTPSDIKIMMGTAKLFCRTTDDVFATWCRKKLCSIR